MFCTRGASLQHLPFAQLRPRCPSLSSPANTVEPDILNLRDSLCIAWACGGFSRTRDQCSRRPARAVPISPPIPAQRLSLESEAAHVNRVITKFGSVCFCVLCQCLVLFTTLVRMPLRGGMGGGWPGECENGFLSWRPKLNCLVFGGGFGALRKYGWGKAEVFEH